MLPSQWDRAEKLGQIAHLDGNRANGSEDDLVYLCLSHHSQYDSRTSQRKNYTLAEVKEYRDRIYEAVAVGRDLPWQTSGAEQSQANLTERAWIAVEHVEGQSDLRADHIVLRPS